MICLQLRDFELLRLCYEQQFLTFDHIKVFLGGHPSKSYRRISRLEEAGLIGRIYHFSLGGQSLVRLTPLAERTVEEKYLVHLPVMRRLNLSTLVHDALVTSARLRLSPFWDARFVPERAIKTQEFPEIPDGIFYFKNGKGVAIEVENSDKGRFRFSKLLDRWKSQPTIGFVLYIASTPELNRIVRGYLTGTALYVEPLIGVVSWDELKKSVPRVYTQIGEVDLFSKREVFSS